MSERRPTKTWSKPDIDRMLEAMSVVLEPGFQLATWPQQEPEIIDGRPVVWLAHPEYHPVVSELWRLCYETSAFISPYQTLPEDPPGTEGRETLFEVLCARDMESATLNQVRRYLILCTRGERFCDGLIAGEFENGRLQAAVRRLQEIQAEAGLQTKRGRA